MLVFVDGGCEGKWDGWLVRKLEGWKVPEFTSSRVGAFQCSIGSRVEQPRNCFPYFFISYFLLPFH